MLNMFPLYILQYLKIWCHVQQSSYFLYDKAFVPIGEPENLISTGVHGHHRSLVCAGPGTVLAALNHDFHLFPHYWNTRVTKWFLETICDLKGQYQPAIFTRVSYWGGGNWDFPPPPKNLKNLTTSLQQLKFIENRLIQLFVSKNNTLVLSLWWQFTFI